MKSVFFLSRFVFLFSILFPLAAWAQPFDPGLFQPSTLVSVEISKNKLKGIYQKGGHSKTLHCGCFFDKINQVHPNSCDRADRKLRRKRTSEVLDWFHAVPVAEFAGALKCWDNKVCGRAGETPYQGARCCAEISPKYKTREADMHNLFPTLSSLNAAGAPSSAQGLSEYAYCANEKPETGSPRAGVRGDFARAYFYMSYQYKLPLPEEREDVLRRWHLEDPPDAWEETRNSMIEVVQGNRNPFIDRPELVERVRDF